MKTYRSILRSGGAWLWLAAAGTTLLAQPNQPALTSGATIQWGDRSATLTKLDDLPYVDSEFTRRFKFDSAANPKLAELRRRYELDAVVAPGHDEFDRQVRLLDWVHHQFKRFGRPAREPRGALEILEGIEQGKAYFCSQYAHLFVSAAASLGWVDRELALRRHRDPPHGGSSEHSTTEIWSNQYRKWIMMDPTAKMYLERDGMPLNAYEIREAWFHHGGRDLVFVVGKERKRYRKADLPIFLARFEGFGDLTIPADELDKYGFIGYIPNTDLMDAGLDYGRMFITQDDLCAGTRWHIRPAPPNPAVDPYFPIGQAALSLRPEAGRIRVTIRTLTPNFKTFEARRDDGLWTPIGADYLWDLRPGANRLEVRTVNHFEVRGPSSIVEIQ